MTDWSYDIEAMPLDKRVLAMATRVGWNKVPLVCVVIKRRNMLSGTDQFYVAGAAEEMHQLDVCEPVCWAIAPEPKARR